MRFGPWTAEGLQRSQKLILEYNLEMKKSSVGLPCGMRFGPRTVEGLQRSQKSISEYKRQFETIVIW